MTEPADKLGALADVVRALDRVGAAHALVGGVAVGLRSGVPRATIDTDVAVRSTVERRAITEALTAAGLELTGTFAHSAMKERAAADPARRRSQALRDQADVELLRGDVPDPDEGW
ncbi:MAG: hypothetical protein HYR51_03175 [Candidatus Rokubacteria bacterium]|nr:hypothetical protein [Candidatus Rokubacteria bacterium]